MPVVLVVQAVPVAKVAPAVKVGLARAVLAAMVVVVARKAAAAVAVRLPQADCWHPPRRRVKRQTGVAGLNPPCLAMDQNRNQWRYRGQEMPEGERCQGEG